MVKKLFFFVRFIRMKKIFVLAFFSLPALAISSDDYKVWRNQITMSANLIEKVDKLENNQMINYDSIVKLYEFSRRNKEDGGCYQKQISNRLCVCHGVNGLVMYIDNSNGFIVDLEKTSSENNLVKCL